MDDEDGLGSPGLSGWAGFQLGRMAAERDQHTSETIAAVFGSRRPTINVAALQAQNQDLAAENARLRQALSDYELNYGNLKAWANRAEAKIELLLKERG